MVATRRFAVRAFAGSKMRWRRLSGTTQPPANSARPAADLIRMPAMSARRVMPFGRRGVSRTWWRARDSASAAARRRGRPSPRGRSGGQIDGAW